MNLKDAKVLVTGGSSGIGKATAELLVKKGAKVAITGRQEEKLNRVATAINAMAILADAGTPEGVQKTIVTLEKQWNGLDVLINNAAWGQRSTLEDYQWQLWESMFATNLFGVAMLTKAVLPFFEKAGKGNIVNIASSAALKGYAGGGVYAASKFALRGLTQCWQAELRPKNIRVMLIHPSEVPTAFGQSNREPRPEVSNKLTAVEIAHATVAALEMDDRGFIPELNIWATNPFEK